MTTPDEENSNTPKYSAPKDKNCPYCGQAFTSSSLGRHLDLYIKPKNPKPPDGIHDVGEIKKLRGNITRRQPRTSLSRRESSTPISTPKLGPRKDSMSQNNCYRLPKDAQFAVDSAIHKFPLQSRWEVNGAVADISEREGDEASKRTGGQRIVSRQVAQKTQFDAKQKMADVVDTARATELALREVLSSWRAARQQVDANSAPFDFDPLSLDFPALTLQCLQPPPTLYSSTQHPTSTSWSVQCPGAREFDALRSYFKQRLDSWKESCVAATTEAAEDLTHPSAAGLTKRRHDMVRKAEQSAEHLEGQINEHLQSAYDVWDVLPPPRQNELWVLELARGVGRKHKEAEKMKDEQRKLQQENANLKSQLEELKRMQQPREFQMLSPATIPIEKDVFSVAFDQTLKAAGTPIFNLDDREMDINNLITKSIERWKNVVTSSRSSSGMAAQRTLDGQQSNQGTDSNGTYSQTPSQAPTPVQGQNPHQPPKRMSTTSISGGVSEQNSSATNTGPPSVEENSEVEPDQDADAEMEDDDSFAMMHHTQHSPMKHAPPTLQQQQQQPLDVPRVRPMQQQRPAQQQPDPRFLITNGAGSPVNRAAINMSRSMPNMNMTMQNNGLHGDINMAMQGNHMYME